jgi:deoxyribonuclease V
VTISSSYLLSIRDRPAGDHYTPLHGLLAPRARRRRDGRGFDESSCQSRYLGVIDSLVSMDVAHPLEPPGDSAEMHAWQDACAALVRLEPGDTGADLVAAADVAYALDESLAYAAVVVLRRGSFREIERRTWSGPPPHPYQSGRFSLREAACLIPALEALATRPDVLVIDGHGIAHPRRFGLACHLGVLFDLPAIGCAKQPLAGVVGVPGPERGARASIVLDGREVGVALRTRAGVNPVYVSPGHRFDVAGAAALMLALATEYRIPEPLRQAHHVSITLRGTPRGADAPRGDDTHSPS